MSAALCPSEPALRRHAGVECHAIDPRRYGALGSESSESAPDVQIRVLTQILEVLFRPCEGQADAGYEVVVAHGYLVEQPLLSAAVFCQSYGRHQLPQPLPEAPPAVTDIYGVDACRYHRHALNFEFS